MVKKTFNEKLNDSKDMPKMVLINDEKSIERYGGKKMIIAPPLDYNKIMSKIPEGRIITVTEIRNYLAEKYDADFTCPLTAGIFISLAAQASHERSTDKIPYWRTLKKDGELNSNILVVLNTRKRCWRKKDIHSLHEAERTSNIM